MTNNHARDSQTVYLFEVAGFLWRRKWPILGVMILSFAASVAGVLLMPSWYRADVLLAPADEAPSAPLLGQFGGLASLAGISLGSTNMAEAVATLESRELTTNFIEKLNLLPILFADEWDAELGRWKNAGTEDEPDVRDGIELFNERIRTVTQDRRTDLVTLSVEWTDPILAAEWANSLVTMLNERMRERALTSATKNVEFLREELESTSAVAMQQSISRLLEGELEKLMLARGNDDFAFRIVDRATVPKKKSRPRRAVLVAFMTMASTLITSLTLVLLEANRQSKFGKTE